MGRVSEEMGEGMRRWRIGSEEVARGSEVMRERERGNKRKGRMTEEKELYINHER